MSPQPNKHAGFTLVETLISTSVFLMVTAAILTALIVFLRFHYSYSQTASFSSHVRINHEKMMQELRSSYEVVEADAHGLTVKMRDLRGAEWKLTYFTTPDGQSLMRKAIAADNSITISEVHDRLASVAFAFYDRNGSPLPMPPSDLKRVRAVRLEITPQPRPQMFFGSDDETVRNAGNSTVVNAAILIRNSPPST